MGFIVGVTLPEREICNLEMERDEILKLSLGGKRVVVYGQRNTGKTSLLKNSIIPAFKKKYKKGLVLFVDLMGVTSIDSISERIRISFQEALSQSKPAKSYLVNLTNSLKSFRPNASIDPITGNLSFSIGLDKNDVSVPFSMIFNKIKDYHLQHRAMIVMDEFQDIAMIQEAESKMRAALQDLPFDLTVVVSGSKKHLLSKIFSPANAPLANWGIDILIPNIESDHYRQKYHKYINEKFSQKKLAISLEVTNDLIDALGNIPEAVNTVCSHILESGIYDKDINDQDIITAIDKSVEERGPRFEEYLAKMTTGEIEVLTLIAKHGPITSPKGKKFLRLVNKISPSAVFKIIKRLENNAEIYSKTKGYTLADPILARYLQLKR
ncbi:MAG: ATP-binding protein [Bacteriovoracaceae bacterium]|nr:ATP-binding protein [Bacteriovoracaceae bacterium]